MFYVGPNDAWIPNTIILGLLVGLENMNKQTHTDWYTDSCFISIDIMSGRAKAHKLLVR